MKKRELAPMKQAPITEIDAALRTLMGQLDQLRFDLVAGKVKNIRALKETKRSIAQLLTLRQHTVRCGVGAVPASESAHA
jgi:ribosomal protein L29